MKRKIKLKLLAWINVSSLEEENKLHFFFWELTHISSMRQWTDHQWRVPESTGFHRDQDIRPQRIWLCPQAFELLTKEYQIWWCTAYGALFPVAVKVALCDK